jgi:hypothetical protein
MLLVQEERETLLKRSIEHQRRFRFELCVSALRNNQAEGIKMDILERIKSKRHATDEQKVLIANNRDKMKRLAVKSRSLMEGTGAVSKEQGIRFNKVIEILTRRN